MPFVRDELQSTLRSWLATLGIERLVLAIHDPSFPSTPEEDTGRGSPYSLGARRLLAFLAAHGFDGVQFGPQGDTSVDNPSPYDGALFTRSPLSIALGSLAEDPDWAPLCDGLRAAGPPHGDRVAHAAAWHEARRALAGLHARFSDGSTPELARRWADFRAGEQEALQPDGDYEALSADHGTDDWRRWHDARTGDLDQWLPSPPPGRGEAAARRLATLRARRAPEIERHLFGQFVLGEQHAALRRAAAQAGLGLYGDLQIGFSHRDLWSCRALFRTDYLMGAPPSRTNPDGQPWGYPVLDPGQYGRAGAPGPVAALLVRRVDRMLADFDGLRIDHPHGLVCPWVYRPDDSVARGARLFCSPALPDHPTLARLAIPTAAQISADPGIPRYADDWVVSLEPDQVTRYAALFDIIMARVAAAGRLRDDVVCEVLSTWPRPLRAVMERYGLGRFVVTQKADLHRPDDVYRSENASPHDWIMVGNHDTRPIWLLASIWHHTAAGSERARQLAARLMPDVARRPALAGSIAADPRHLCQAMFAELFASKARRVSVFFADLFGLSEIYNRPGVVDGANWTLRLGNQFEAEYRTRLRKGEALNLPLALALALRARGEEAKGLWRAAQEASPELRLPEG